MKTIQFPLRFVKYLDSLHYTRTQDNIQNRNIAWRQACTQDSLFSDSFNKTTYRYIKFIMIGCFCFD